VERRKEQMQHGHQQQHQQQRCRNGRLGELVAGQGRVGAKGRMVAVVAVLACPMRSSSSVYSSGAMIVTRVGSHYFRGPTLAGIHLCDACLCRASNEEAAAAGNGRQAAMLRRLGFIPEKVSIVEASTLRKGVCLLINDRPCRLREQVRRHMSPCRLGSPCMLRFY
jgi:hypothetical protein